MTTTYIAAARGFRLLVCRNRLEYVSSDTDGIAYITCSSDLPDMVKCHCSLTCKIKMTYGVL